MNKYEGFVAAVAALSIAALLSILAIVESLPKIVQAIEPLLEERVSTDKEP